MEEPTLPIALQRKGVTVFHVYKNHDPSQGLSTFWFTTNPTGDPDDEFDVTELEAYEDAETIRETLELAVDRGELKPFDGGAYLSQKP